jgi:2-polyprenyl-3-methyl-5-hydroxy-6-metoxy-1,4-benzoquinol methylase
LNDKIWSKNEAEAWDLVVPKRQTVREVNFLTWAFRQYADRRVKIVLDLACGTGRLAIELASRGYNITGMDKFDDPIAKARENAAKRSVDIEVVKSSLQEMNIHGNFDSAYCVQALYYLLNEQELSKFLKKLHSILRPGGLLIIDTGNFISMFGSYEKVRTLKNSGKNWQVSRRIANRIDDVNMLFYHVEHSTMTVGGKTKRWNETHVLRMWTFPELRAELLTHGFTKIHIFGKQKAGSKEANDHAPRLVIVAKRP